MLYIPFDYAQGRLKNISSVRFEKTNPIYSIWRTANFPPFTSPFEKAKPIGRLWPDTRNERAELKEQSQFVGVVNW